MENITSVDYRNVKRVFKNFNHNKNIDDYHDLYDILLLAHEFENLRNKCIKIYEFDPANILSAPR